MLYDLFIHTAYNSGGGFMFYKVHTFATWAAQRNGDRCIYDDESCVPSAGRAECVDCYANYVKHSLLQDRDKLYSFASRNGGYCILLLSSILLKYMEK